jgi:hypothetical protein
LLDIFIKMEIQWQDCDPRMENFLENITAIDPLNNLEMMSLICFSYYEINEERKSPRDLELFLRNQNNLQVGLIAVDWRKDPHYAQMINDKKGVIIKRKYFQDYVGQTKIKSIANVNPEHLADYVTFVSCRPRDYVIQETLTHSESMEENLEKLEEAGEMITFTQDNSTLAEGDIKISEERLPLTNLIQKGKKLIKIREVNFEEVFQKCFEQHPDAEAKVIRIMHDGSSLLALIKESQIICPIGINITFNQDGEKVAKYLPLQ